MVGAEEGVANRDVAGGEVDEEFWDKEGGDFLVSLNCIN